MATNLSPQIISRLLGEIRELVRSPPEGVKYISEDDEGSGNTVSEIHAIISGPEETPFYGGKFKMKLVLGEDYPSSPPRGFFLTKIYHPNISSTGDICVNTLKKDWTSEVSLKHVLQVIRCLLIVPFPESSLNDEAGKLFMDSYEEFARRARIMTEVHATTMDCENEGENISQKELNCQNKRYLKDGTSIEVSSSEQNANEVKGVGGSEESRETKELQKKKDGKKKALKRL